MSKKLDVQQLPAVTGLKQARIDEYQGPWAIEPQAGAALHRILEATDFAEHVRQYREQTERQDAQPEQAAGDRPGRYGYELQDGVAVVRLEGTLMKQESSFGGTSTVAARRAIKNAAADPNVGAIMLVFDSPGGTSAGTGDLADAVAEAAKLKPTMAYCEDCCCSAAYFVASQADRVLANAGATVGSIGTYMVVRDLSGMYAANGIKVHVVRAGKQKGVGTPGTELTAEQLTDLQRHVEEVNAQFKAAVMRGRKLNAEQIEALADGGVHVGQAAIEKKLIDGVASWEQALGELQQKLPRRKGTTKMDEKKAATSQEIRQACGGATAEFILAQTDKGATLAEATAAYIVEQNTKLTALGEQVKTLQTEKATLQTQLDELKANAGKGRGAAPLKESGKQTGGGEDVVQRFEDAVKAEMAASGKSRHEAVAAVFRKDDALRQEYVAAKNAA
ncbi:MAG: S49 family peptidase [Planctomycetales bacterium]|nr:S49 family peptidase [Planctomycetales bacterium]